MIPPPSAAGPAAVPPTPVTARRLRILLIEDNPADARLTRERLRDSGDCMDCDTIATLREVTAERLADIDCALIDLGLPDASGVQALEWVQSLAPHLPTVVLTGFDDEVTGLVALRQGAQDYLSKHHADGFDIARAIRFAVARKQLQLTADHQRPHELDLADDIVQQLYAVGLALATTQRRLAEQQLPLAVRIDDHMNQLQRVIHQLRSTILAGDPRGGPQLTPTAPSGVSAETPKEPSHRNGAPRSGSPHVAPRAPSARSAGDAVSSPDDDR